MPFYEIIKSFLTTLRYIQDFISNKKEVKHHFHSNLYNMIDGRKSLMIIYFSTSLKSKQFPRSVKLAVNILQQFNLVFLKNAETKNEIRNSMN